MFLGYVLAAEEIFELQKNTGEVLQNQVKNSFEKLRTLRTYCGKRTTIGLHDDVIAKFIGKDSALREAIDKAAEAFDSLGKDEQELLQRDEESLGSLLQAHYVNFYPSVGINPYIPLAASGPWIVTTHGAVLHDSGGYGMLGMGHAPSEIIGTLSKPWVMANVMTPSLSQKRFADRLFKEIGHTRDTCPFSHFICLNSGSEAVTITSRIVDIHAKNQTKPDAVHAGKSIRTLALEDSFHGRTGFPAMISHSTRNDYEEYLASFGGDVNVDFIPINDEEKLVEIFKNAEREGIFYQAFYVEPIMGEGIPGQAVNRSFYDKARKLTAEHLSLFIVDSIQAALRAHGCLSIVDYPGFVGCDAPDMEAYSKALNAGQFPLSVVALREEIAQIYQTGVYGNTMTTNPRGLEVGYRVLNAITDDLRTNIRERGVEFVEKLETLQREFPEAIFEVIGTGLIVSMLLNPETYTVGGSDGFEQYLRSNGIEMIHGGPNGLRFTPHFAITSEEIDLIVDVVRSGLIALR